MSLRVEAYQNAAGFSDFIAGESEVIYKSCILYINTNDACRFHLLYPRLVPLTTLVKLDTISTKHVQCTSDSQIYLAATQTLYQFEILQIATTACVCYRD